MGPWGTIDLATGVFTEMGNLGSVFEGDGNGPPALAFDSAGDLIAVGLGPDYVPTVLDLNVTTGVYTTTTVPFNSTAGMLAENAWDLGGMGSMVTAPTPKPSNLVLLGVGAIGLIGFTWRRRSVGADRARRESRNLERKTGGRP